jgi:MoaD family protein
MSVKVRIPSPLRSMSQGKREIELEGQSVIQVFNEMEVKYDGLKGRIFDEGGEVRKFINIYVNDEDIRHLNGLNTELKDGDILSIIPAVAGGVPQTFQDKLAELKKKHDEVTPEEVNEKIQVNKDIVLLDVREGEEYRKGHLPDAIHLSRSFLEIKIESTIPDRNTPVICYCAGGTRSLFATETLQKMGYTSVESMSGGYGAWNQRRFKTEIPQVLSEADRNRYSRHISIPEVGEEGQLKLLSSKVLLIGAGGLGCPNAYYLSAAGVGTLGIVDFDVVDESNLQRQILHTSESVGTSKIESATKTISAFNPNTRIIPFEERLESSNIEKIFKNFDIVVDGSDNFPTRYLINDACVKLKIPCIHGSVYRFDGQVTVFDTTRGGPCYRCLYPEPPPPELAPSCADAGVLGVLPGVIGLLQAVEAIKLIVGIGKPMVGKLLSYDALNAEFKEFKLKRNVDCDYCGEGKKFPGYIDYEMFCSNRSTS